MKSIFLTLLLSASLSASASNVDLKGSSFKWLGTKVTGKHFGKITLKSAEVKQTKAGFIKSGSFIIDMNSMTIDDLKGEWAGKFLGHMKSPDFFNVQKFPQAKFEVRKDDGKKLYGTLTIKGKSNPVEFTYKKNGKTYSGVMKFDRTKFDMRYGSGSFFKNLGDKMINDEVTLDFKVVLK